jgi:hypothetical protein
MTTRRPYTLAFSGQNARNMMYEYEYEKKRGRDLLRLWSGCG